MKLAFIRTKIQSTVFLDVDSDATETDPQSLEKMKISLKAGSSSKNIIAGLQKYNLVTGAEEWKLWNGPLKRVALPEQMPVNLFPCEEDLTSRALADYILESGQPDILWVEGRDYPAYIKQIFDLCPNSFKIIYSKHWEPWKVEKLGDYNLCLVDEDWQIEVVKKKYPAVECHVWDKLIDYQGLHFPMQVPKKYDLCYVAYLRSRKKHSLLLNALSEIRDRRLSCIFIGKDRKNNLSRLQARAQELDHDIAFVGEVAKGEVNRYINASRIGVMCAKLDAAPRVILEYMAADVPVLVNARLWAGGRYVGPAAGRLVPPEDFHHGIIEMLDNLDTFSPRQYFLEHYSFEKVMQKFIDILERSGCNIRAHAAELAENRVN